MKIVVDTNIIFSALLSPEGTISSIIFNSGGTFSFYSCDYLLFEIQKHWKKLLKLSGIPNAELMEARDLLFARIIFIRTELISKQALKAAFKIARDIDPDDSEFIALTEHLHGLLWTGDKKLYNGLKMQAFDSVINTLELQNLILPPNKTGI